MQSIFAMRYSGNFNLSFIVQGLAIKGITKDELLNKLITLSNEEDAQNRHFFTP